MHTRKRMQEMSELSLSSNVQLRSGGHMPLFGLGTWAASDEESKSVVLGALRCGYRLIDTAAMYNNEEGIGQALAQWLEETGKSRSEVFITSKLLPSDHGDEMTVVNAFKASLNRLGLTYLDLYLIHNPSGRRVVSTWRALMALKRQGLVKDIGVSNFGSQHIQGLIDAGLEVPALNQIELHVFNQQKATVEYCKSKGIVVEGFCPLARCKRFGVTKLVDMATRLGVSEADICLRWSVQSGIVTIPKTANVNRLAGNAAIFSLKLSDSDMQEISQLDEEYAASLAVGGMKLSWTDVM